ncbi:VOC family protein [Streptomyces sp. NPDC048430]|uniref:VOC family protein n=1 Tax=unclassified Streptomyces TaxID=2593676 RepID=UPI0034318739
MIAELRCVVLDCPDPARLARFCAAGFWTVPRSRCSRRGRRWWTAGTTLVDRGDDARGWRVFADPAGHPFCLLRH